jgi:hypothetical protein
MHPLPAPIADPGTIAHLNIRRRDRLGVPIGGGSSAFGIDDSRPRNG